MINKLVLSLLLVGTFLFVGCKFKQASYTKDAVTVGPEGEIILFKKQGEQIFIKECKKLSSLQAIASNHDCVERQGSKVAMPTVLEFSNHLKTVLKLSNAKLDSPYKEKVEIFKKGKNQQDDLSQLQANRDRLNKEIAEIRQFMEGLIQMRPELSEEEALQIAGKENFDRLSAELKKVQSNIANDINSVTLAINDLIVKLIDDIIASPKLTIFTVADTGKNGFFYHILYSYVKNPVIKFEFIDLSKVTNFPATFNMGSMDGEADRDSDETLHQVTLNKPFWIGKYEVTQAQWFEIMGNSPSRFSRSEHCTNFDSKRNICPDLPVENVSWNDIQEYLRKLNKRNDGFIYRLPTEAEWEFAARAGTTTPFNLGDNISSDNVNYDGNYPYNNGPKGIYREKTVRVGSLPNANVWGLFDMHGNVWEWTSDWYGKNYYNNSMSSSDPKGPNSGSDRVIRGGSWVNYARYCRSADRNNWGPSYRYSDVGFRLVRTNH